MERIELGQCRSPRPVIMTLLTGFLFLALVITDALPFPWFYGNPTIPISLMSTYNWVWNTALAFLVATSTVGVLATTAVADGTASVGSGPDRFGRACFLIVTLGMLGLLPLLLYQVLGFNAIFFLVVDVGLFVVFLAVRGRSAASGGRAPP